MTPSWLRMCSGRCSCDSVSAATGWCLGFLIPQPCCLGGQGAAVCLVWGVKEPAPLNTAPSYPLPWFTQHCPKQTRESLLSPPSNNNLVQSQQPTPAQQQLLLQHHGVGSKATYRLHVCFSPKAVPNCIITHNTEISISFQMQNNSI